MRKLEIMSIRYILTCDLCSKQAENIYNISELPPYWSKTYMLISYNNNTDREIPYYICSECYLPDDIQNDMPKKDTILNKPSKSVNNIFKQLWKKCLTKK